MREKYRAKFATEADLCSAFILDAAKRGWIAYPETCGFDIVLVRKRDGAQIGIQAKLTLNVKVILQIAPGHGYLASTGPGPDYRAILIPYGAASSEMREVARLLGINVIELSDSQCPEYVKWKNLDHPTVMGELPNVRDTDATWFDWNPAERLKLPEYIPDVAAGSAAPVQLSPWKVRAIKLLILLDRRGFVVRRDMKDLSLSATIWVTPGSGYLAPHPTARGAFVRCHRTPDLRAQHPVNFSQIEADFDQWAPPLRALPPQQMDLIGSNVEAPQ